MMSTLITSGYQPNFHNLDNEASYIPNKGLLKNKIKYQLVPPPPHIQNAPERNIKKFKAHFITCICAANPVYPAKEWYRFLSQEILTL